MRVSTSVILSCLLLGACSSTSSKPSPMASGNDNGILKIGNPYQIEGQTYTPAYAPEYDEVGVASWYGPGFHGRSTANGERFNQNAMTAAHRTLPMPSVVRVTNLENGRSAVVKVNDRGPFAKSRIIDLSKAAANKLGVVQKGTAQVRVEYLPEETRILLTDLLQKKQLKADERTLAMLNMNNVAMPAVATAQPSSSWSLISSAEAATPYAADTAVSEQASLTPVVSQDLPPIGGKASRRNYVAELKEPVPSAARAAVEPAAAAEGVFIQAGSFSKQDNAHELSRKIASVGRAVVKSVDVGGQTWYRVRLGPLRDMGSAHAALADLQSLGVTNAKVVTD